MASGSGGFPALRAIPGAVDSESAGGGGGAQENPLETSNAPTVPPPGMLPSFADIPLPTHGDTRMQLAIAAGSRAEASLSGLFRAIEHLSNGAGAAREANEQLTQELEILREMLGRANEQYLASKHKISLLELALERTRRDAERDRAFLIDQHDAFIIDLMDEHDGSLERQSAEIGMLRDRLLVIEHRNSPTVAPPSVQVVDREKVTEAPPPFSSGVDRAEFAELQRTAQKLGEDRERAREAMQRLQAQRDEAQVAVDRLARERDEALEQVRQLKSELGGPRLPLSTRPPSFEARRTEAKSTKPPVSAARAVRPELSLDQSEMDARLSRPPAAASTPPAEPPRPSASLRAASVIPSDPKPPSITSVLDPPPSKPRPSVPASNFSPPPEELRQALTVSPSLQPRGATSSRPPLKQKPDPSTRPLVGYSVSTDSIQPERIETLRPSARPKPSEKP